MNLSAPIEDAETGDPTIGSGRRVSVSISFLFFFFYISVVVFVVVVFYCFFFMETKKKYDSNQATSFRAPAGRAIISFNLPLFFCF